MIIAAVGKKTDEDFKKVATRKYKKTDIFDTDIHRAKTYIPGNQNVIILKNKFEELGNDMEVYNDDGEGDNMLQMVFMRQV